MAGYTDIGGVRTWYDERGAGDPVVLLHGGLTDNRDFTGNLDGLATGSGCSSRSAGGTVTPPTPKGRSRPS